MSLRRRTNGEGRPTESGPGCTSPSLCPPPSRATCLFFVPLPLPPSSPYRTLVWCPAPFPCGNPSRSSPASLRSCPLLTPSLVSTPPAEHRAKRRLPALALALTLPWPGKGRGSFASALLLLPSPPALLPLLLPRLFPPESGPPAPSALACQTAEHRFLSLSSCEEVSESLLSFPLFFHSWVGRRTRHNDVLHNTSGSDRTRTRTRTVTQRARSPVDRP